MLLHFNTSKLVANLNKELKLHEKKQAQAVNKSLSKIATEIRKTIQKKHGVKYKHTKVKLKKIKRVGDPAFIHRYSGKIFADHKKGGLARVAKRYKTPTSSWVLKKKGQIFRRDGKARLPIARTEVGTFDITEIYRNMNGEVKLSKFVQKEYERLLNLSK